MNYKILVYPFVLVWHTLIVHACPVCTFAFGTTAAATSYIGLDVSIFGLFIGAFSMSGGFWLSALIKKEYFRFQSLLILFLSVLLSATSVFFIDLGTFEFYERYWAGKALIGLLLGAAMSLGALYVHRSLLKTNKEQYVPYQRVSITFISLSIMAIGLHYTFSF